MLTWKEICRRRLGAQHLRARLPAASFPRMVSDICGLHAQVMSSAELAAAVRVDGMGRGTIATALWSDRTLVKAWAMRGTLHLRFGPSDGNRVTFVRPDQWVAALPRLDPVESLAEVARRYLAAYGPARVEEFARWWGVQPKAVRGVLTAGYGFTQVEVEGGKPAWTVPDVPVVTGEEAPVVRLLPLFDPYTVAVRRNGERPLPGPEKDLVYRKAGWISPVLLVDGEIAGVWEHTEDKSRLLVEVRPFAALEPAVIDSAAAEADRLAAYLGLPADFTVGGFAPGRGRKNLS